MAPPTVVECPAGHSGVRHMRDGYRNTYKGLRAHQTPLCSPVHSLPFSFHVQMLFPNLKLSLRSMKDPHQP